jgi:pyruvate/2-oxoglutarate dehydrogenase complex dihydrolipoamide acyltransferase (E2) component
VSSWFLRRYSEELARLYLEKAFEEPFQKKLPTETEVRKFLEENQAKLARPVRVRLAHLALLAPRSDAEARARKGADAQKLLQELRRTAKDECAFGRRGSTSRSSTPASSSRTPSSQGSSVPWCRAPTRPRPSRTGRRAATATVTASPTTRTLNRVRGTAADDVWAVGDGGTILHWDGIEWSEQASGTPNDLDGVWAVGTTAFAAGPGGRSR